MTRFRIIVLTWCVAALAVADTVTVKPEAYVKGPSVLLGEIADIEGDNAETLSSVVIVQAALPGVAKKFSASLVESRIRNAGFEGTVAISGSPQITAHTLAQELSAETLTADLQRYIESEMPWEIDDAQITIDIPRQAVVIPEGDVQVQWTAGPLYRWIGPAAFRGDVIVDGDVKQTVQVRASVEAYEDVLIVINDVARGSMISAADISIEKRALSQLRPGTLTEPEEAVGQLAKSTLMAGAVLTNRQIMPRRLIKRNQAVNVETRVRGLSVRGRARAMGDGHAGDMIPLINPDTKAEFYGVVQADGSVLVE
ncbi:MAG: hypothetical protein AMXMBFR84_09500 [Candidatus Hydrogenedentota bacterium]